MIRIVLIAMIAATLSGCGPSAEERQAVADRKAQDERLEKSLAAAKQYFGTAVEAGSWGKWTVTSVKPGSPNPFLPKTNSVIVEIAIPPAQAKDIIGRDTSAQYRAVGRNACPRKGDAVWQSFGSEDYLTVNPAISGSVFADVDCREHALP